MISTSYACSLCLLPQPERAFTLTAQGVPALPYVCISCAEADPSHFELAELPGPSMSKKKKNKPSTAPTSSSSSSSPSTPEQDFSTQLHRREVEVRKLRDENRRLTSALASAEDRCEVLGGFGAGQASSSLISAPRPIIQAPKLTKDRRREATAVVLCSDWHVEEVVDPIKVNGLNEFNLDIADYRIKRLTEGVLWLLDMHSSHIQIENVVLWLGGDLMSGFIHEDLMQNNSLSPTETILWLQARLHQMISSIGSARGVKKLTIPCSWGNHGRTSLKPRIATAAENSYEWLLYQQLARQPPKTKAELVWDVSKAELKYVDVYGKTLRFTHGDQIKYSDGVGGITIPLSKKIASWNIGKHADITCIGHWHQDISLPHAVVNGALVGYGPYSTHIGARFEQPSQSFFLVDSDHGKCCSTPIWL